MHGEELAFVQEAMVKEFYALQGFEKIREDGEGNTEWQFVIPKDYENKTDVITVEY